MYKFEISNYVMPDKLVLSTEDNNNNKYLPYIF